jgi:hypothetical protein
MSYNYTKSEQERVAEMSPLSISFEAMLSDGVAEWVDVLTYDRTAYAGGRLSVYVECESREDAGNGNWAVTGNTKRAWCARELLVVSQRIDRVDGSNEASITSLGNRAVGDDGNNNIIEGNNQCTVNGDTVTVQIRLNSGDLFSGNNTKGFVTGKVIFQPFPIT